MGCDSDSMPGETSVVDEEVKKEVVQDDMLLFGGLCGFPAAL